MKLPHLNPLRGGREGGREEGRERQTHTLQTIRLYAQSLEVELLGLGGVPSLKNAIRLVHESRGIIPREGRREGGRKGEVSILPYNRH